MRPLKTFIIYARKDESFKNDLLLHLRGTLIPTGHLAVWQDGEILPGEEWEKKIEEQLEAAELFLILLSIHSLTSEFIQKKELLRALERRSRIVPILVRSCLWHTNPVFAGLQGLPKNMKPVASYTDHDEAWTEVMDGLHQLVESLRAVEKTAPAAKQPDKPAEAPKPVTASVKSAPPEPAPKTPTVPGLPGMVFVKGGTFMMGSPESEEGRRDDETQHQVTLSDFAIGQYPVTQRLWKEIMGNNPSRFKGDNRPVENVSLEEVQSFLQKLNARYPGQHYRLPAEAEWEYAARGGALSNGFIYAGSNVLDEVGWYAANSDKQTHPVGQKKPNELGLYDMSGNVWEWCTDWYGNYPQGAQVNPRGPDQGDYRVRRGGGYWNDPQGCRVAYRINNRPAYRSNSIGFRLAFSFQSDDGPIRPGL